MRLNLRTSAVGDPRPAAGSTTLLLEGVRAQYGPVVALEQLSMTVTRGEIVCVLGPSGSGKSTLLRLIAGVDRPSAGRIAVDGIDVAGPTGFVEPEARRIGMVFQDYALFPHLTIADNVAFGIRGARRDDVRRQVAALLERLGLERFARSYPHMLSGGERQRVALARAMAPGPRVLLMDEPFSSLDVRLREDVRRYTLDYLRDTGTTTVIVTHDPDEAMRMADRIALLQRGRLIQYGPPDEIYSHPVSLFAARLVGDVNVLHGICSHGVIDTPLGRFPAAQLDEGVAAQVCVRPEHVRLAVHPAVAHGRVIDRTRLGEIEQLRLAVSGVDLPVIVRVFGRTGTVPGAHVALDILPEDALVLPDDADLPNHL